MTQETRRRHLVAEDLYNLVFVSDPQISPDGTQIAYVRTIIDGDTKEYRSTIWMVDATENAVPGSLRRAPNRTPRPAGLRTVQDLPLFQTGKARGRYLSCQLGEVKPAQ